MGEKEEEEELAVEQVPAEADDGEARRHQAKLVAKEDEYFQEAQVVAVVGVAVVVAVLVVVAVVIAAVFEGPLRAHQIAEANLLHELKVGGEEADADRDRDEDRNEEVEEVGLHLLLLLLLFFLSSALARPTQIGAAKVDNFGERVLERRQQLVAT